jgi:light-regulated signal transduction histidine kinase (bacteriophytochrome)
MRVLGNITLLERPLRTVTLVATVHSALTSRRRQWQARDHIRELQKAREHLAQANADLTQFAFVASHDLQEPLRMVTVFTQLLAERYVDQTTTRAQEFAGYIRTGVVRMEALLRDLLQYSRAIHEQREWPRLLFDLRCAVNDAKQALQLEIDRTGTQISFDSLPVVRGDQAQLSLVFQNLLSNSIKYAKPGITPLIQVSYEQTETTYLIRVQDNGIGFDQKYAEKVFELFQRLDVTSVPGTGLGLAISRRIVERHGGRMWAESRPGLGSCFMFTLPNREEAP